MKQNLWFFALLMISVSSCTTVQFATSQPKDAEILTEFPANLIGSYYGSDKDSHKDSLIITKNSIQEKKSSSANVLEPDKLVLKKSNEYYILSGKESETWGVTALKQKGNKLSIYVLAYDKESEVELISKIEKITKVIQIQDSSEKAIQYIINPSKEQFQLLLDRKVFVKYLELKKTKP